jgi:hypothetical protein
LDHLGGFGRSESAAVVDLELWRDAIDRVNAWDKQLSGTKTEIKVQQISRVQSRDKLR